MTSSTSRISTWLALGCAAALTGSAAVAQVNVNADITTSTTWTSNNRYVLQAPIFVRNGATLTIQAGTIITSGSAGVEGGSLLVAVGSQIHVQGTEKNPVIFTSGQDYATWTNGNPRTGTWREAASEWGSLAILGDGYISSCRQAGNVSTPNCNNRDRMEGTTSGPNLYGGCDDDDDSGSISYLSIRYGGKVIALADELNGLSLGAVGRGTDIHHVEIMNNVDDGIEIWGGTVNVKYFSIWNVGDDSFDVDQGWRGKAQFGLIVQGYSVRAAQGSGTGDNCFETDGAEACDWQPTTTATIYNCTVIGQPTSGDYGTAWRANARIQYRNCIFMDLGDRLVLEEADDHTCGCLRYGPALDWPTTWTTPYTFSGGPPLYQAQTSGNLAEIKDSVMFNNLHASAYTEATARGVFAAGNNNVLEPVASPIQSITRAAPVTYSGLTMRRVTSLDPRPANDALVSAAMAPDDGFFCPASWRGAFAPGNNWLGDWTASYAFGFSVYDNWTDVGECKVGCNGCPVLSGQGTLTNGAPTTVSLGRACTNSPSVLVIGGSRVDFPIFGGVLIPNPDLTVQLNTDANGSWSLTFPFPAGLQSGTCIYLQAWVVQPVNPFPLSHSNGLVAKKP